MMKIIKNNPNKGLCFLYNTYVGRILLSPIVKNKFISVVIGKFMDTKLSKILIKPFIKKHNINMSCFENEKYRCFNDFFIRRIKKDARIINHDDSSFIAPCDSRLTCYKITKDLTFKIKNSTYSLSSILNDNSKDEVFKDGIVLVFRLSVEDYHHYVFCDDGTIINNYKIDGVYHSVNPIVYKTHKVFKENKRECTLLKTKNFGKVMYVEVGALLVGKINNLKNKNKFIKGEEKGYFMYGGSTVVLIIQKNKVKINDEILKNSKNGYETYVKLGEKIGKKPF